MASLDETERMEYGTLMSRLRDAERTSEICWVAAGIAALVMLSWGVESQSSGLMLPVVLTAAWGFYAQMRGRQQARMMAGYVEEFFEVQRAGPQWFTRLGQLATAPGASFASDWLATYLANGLVLTGVVFAWVFANDSRHGELMAGIVTGCGLAFAFHSITETSRLEHTDFIAPWRQAQMGSREERRPTRAASR